MSDSHSDPWAPFDEIESKLGVERATLLSHRPGTLARPPAGDGTTDPQSTAYWLEHAGQADTARSATTFAATAAPEDDIEVVEPIARGGMGVVLKAVQTTFRREVALKRPASADPALVAQFLSEARVTGGLDHANIVPVHLLRTRPDGTPELVMKLVRGTSWRELLHGETGAGVDLEAHLRILLAVCNALAYAHRQGVLHRDIKPENVLTDDLGQVYLVDWGIAVGLSPEQCAARGMPHVGGALRPAGTPGYMAPELASGDGTRQGITTDVYLLGACLHEVLTRRRRHEGPTVRDVLQSAVASEPVSYDATIPRELADLCNRAMAARPEDRYPSAESFRGAIEDHLKHRGAHAIAEKGLLLLADLRASIARYNDRKAAKEAARPDAPPPFAAGESGTLVDSAADEDDLEREVHVRFGETQFALSHAIGLWDGLHEAKAALREARRLMLEHALATEDAALAARLAEDPEERARVAALRASLAARAKELSRLRDAARRLDWGATSRPLGALYIAAGVIGCVVAFTTKEILAQKLPGALYINAAVWLLSAIGLGVAALLLLRRAHVPDSLVSPRLLFTWGAVALSCLAVGAFNQLRPVMLAHDMPYAALMIGIGFVAMALQTRRWLLWPAGAFFAGAVLAALVPDRGFDIVGLLWLLGVGAVGVALRLGATLDAGGQETAEDVRKSARPPG